MVRKIDSMEKGVTYPDLDIFVFVGLGNSNESIIEGWSVRKSKYLSLIHI